MNVNSQYIYPPVRDAQFRAPPLPTTVDGETPTRTSPACGALTFHCNEQALEINLLSPAQALSFYLDCISWLKNIKANKKCCICSSSLSVHLIRTQEVHRRCNLSMEKGKEACYRR